MANWRNRLVYLAGALLCCVPLAAQAPTPSQALAFEQQGNWEQAAQVWQAVTKLHPNDAAAFASLGVDLSHQQKYQEAASAYKKALALNPVPSWDSIESRTGGIQAGTLPVGACSAPGGPQS